MPRMISCAMTPDAVRERRKTVTRRTKWKDLKVGTLLWVVEKGQGIPKGGHVNRLALVRVVDVRREALGRILDYIALPGAYGWEEMVLEGLPRMSPMLFMARWRIANGGDLETKLTRIEWEYVATWIPGFPQCPGEAPELVCTIHRDYVEECPCPDAGSPYWGEIDPYTA